MDVGQARANRTEEFQEGLTDGTAVTGNMSTEPQPYGDHVPGVGSQALHPFLD